jgi:hypothetical protein
MRGVYRHVKEARRRSREGDRTEESCEFPVRISALKKKFLLLCDAPRSIVHQEQTATPLCLYNKARPERERNI